MKFYDAFCGIGGFHEGIMQAHPDWECVGACDIDEHAKKIYQKHFPGVKIDDDIRKLDRLPEGTEMFCGGFPCQSFSMAGRRKGFEDTRGTLFFEIARLLQSSRPKWVFLENVKGLLSHDDGRTLSTILYTLGELGYWWEYQVLNSKDFGVPQNRERIFIIGHLAGERSRTVFPLRESSKGINPSFTEAQREGERIRSDDTSDTQIANTLAQGDYKGGNNLIQQINNPSHAGDRIYSPDGIAPSVRARARSDQYASAKVMVVGNNVPSGHEAGNIYSPEEIAPTVRENHGKVTKILQKSQDWRDKGELRVFEGYSPTIRAEMGDTSPIVVEAKPFNCGNINMRGPRMKDDDTSFCIDTHKTSGVFTPDAKIRRLTEVGCERLQGYPDGWTEGISATQRYKCLGNAVTVNVIRAIAERIE